MSKLTALAKGTAAFLVVAVGVSFIVGSLMGGGYGSRASDFVKSVNNDPRSVLVHAVLVETDQPAASLPAAAATLDEAAFDAFVAEAGRGGTGSVTRAPSMLVQHGEIGMVGFKAGSGSFQAALSPRVIDTKHGPVLRLGLEISRVDGDSAEAARTLDISTAYTSRPGGAVVLDLAGLAGEGKSLRLAVRTVLVDPTPSAP